MTSPNIKENNGADKRHHHPIDWEDDLKMTVMFSPFRDRNLNPKSWDQKMEFWSELIVDDCVKSQQAIIDVLQLKKKFRRKGKSPSGLDIVVQEMIRMKQLIQLSDIETFNSKCGWLSWGYNRLVKKPIDWSMVLLSGQQQNNINDTYVVMEVIKEKSRQLLEICSRLAQTDLVNIVEYCQLHVQHRGLCPTDTEFSLVMKELVNSKEVIIQQETNTMLVKFIQRENNEKKIEEITEQDMHIYRIQKAHSEVKRQIEILNTEVQRLATEAVSYKQKGMTKFAMSSMRKRKLAQNRIEKLIGSMETLDEILYRIKQAESNEMILKAIEGGTSVLKDMTSERSLDNASNIMDDLTDVTQTQEDIMAELGSSFIDEPSQSELEDELSIILSENTPPRRNVKQLDVDSDIERELDEILNDTSDENNLPVLKSDSCSKGLTEMLDDLQLPDVPGYTPTKPKKDRQLLTS